MLLLIDGSPASGELAGGDEPWARHHTVIAPELPGHGASEAGGGDYSIGALASGLRDLLLALGDERATVVATRSAAASRCSCRPVPEMVDAWCCSPAAASARAEPRPARRRLPGADLFISLTAGAGQRVGPLLGHGHLAVGLRPNADVAEVARGYASLKDAEPRAAFLDTLRAVVGTAASASTRRAPVPGRGGAGADRLGRPRLDDPARHGEGRGPATRQPARGLRGVGHMPSSSPGRSIPVLERSARDRAPRVRPRRVAGALPARGLRPGGEQEPPPRRRNCACQSGKERLGTLIEFFR